MEYIINDSMLRDLKADINELCEDMYFNGYMSKIATVASSTNELKQEIAEEINKIFEQFGIF